jgi:glutamate/aspartate transport system substrate-binding protein
MNPTRPMPPGLLPLLLLLLMAMGPARAQDSPTLRKIQGTGVVVVGYRVGSVPFSYLDGHFKPIGYTMDLCHRVVTAIAGVLKQGHLTTKLIAVTPATRIPLVANGTVDLECGVTTNTLSRQKSEAFTVTTFVAQSRLLGKKHSQIQSLGDLRSKTVVSTAGTTSISYLNDVNIARNLKMKILAGKDDAESFQMVETDRAVAYAMDDVLLYSLVANARNPDNFLISSEALTVEPYAIALTRNDPAFKKLVDGVLRGLFKSGEIHAIYNKWFLSPIPPKGINLQLPMSAALKRAITSPTDSADPALYQ